jgi:hypothetical protein
MHYMRAFNKKIIKNKMCVCVFNYNVKIFIYIIRAAAVWYANANQIK